MPSVTLNWPAEHTDDIVNALCKANGLDVTPANAKQALIAMIRQTVRNVKQSEAETAALANMREPEEVDVT